MWSELSKEWRTAFEEAWEAFRGGSVPIGAALFDEDGVPVLRDHNRNCEPETVNRHIAHAEANLLRRLDTAKYRPERLTLYTTMEPCPMCMGTAVMSNIKHLRAAARDTHCGMMHLYGLDEYYHSHCSGYVFERGEMELVQITVQSYFELRCIENGAGDFVLEKFRRYRPEAAVVAGRLFGNRELDGLADKNAAFGEVYDYIASAHKKASSGTSGNLPLNY